MNKRAYTSNHLKFLLAGIVFAVLIDRFMYDGTRPYIEEARQEARKEAQTAVVYEEADPVAEAVAAVTESKDIVLAKLEPEIKVTIPGHADYGPDDLPPWRKYAVPVTLDPAKGKVIIVIDDLGVSRTHTKEIMDLPGPLTLSFLPYARGLKGQVKEARQNGHELMVHMPMEPENPDLDMGSIYLSTEETPEVFNDMLGQGLDAFGGYVGINNHMGSRLTQDKPAMEKVMAELKKRGLLFLDSKTIAGTVAGSTAAAYGIPYAVRDVFLDDDPSRESVDKYLKKTEEVALAHGQAIAIGHPKVNTIAALQEWLPTLADKGLQLVPISAAVITTPSAPAQVVYGPAQEPAPQHQ